MKPPIEYRRPKAGKAPPKAQTDEPAAILAHKRAVKAAQMVRYRARQKAAKASA